MSTGGSARREDAIEALLDAGSSAGEAPADGARRKLMLFTVGGHGYAAALGEVLVVVPVERVVPVPGTPAWIPGVINQGGEVAPVVDLDALLHGGTRGSAPLAVVARVEGAPAGVACLVDALDDIVDLELSRLDPPLANASGQGAALVEGVFEHGGCVVSLLSLARLASVAG